MVGGLGFGWITTLKALERFGGSSIKDFCNAGWTLPDTGVEEVFSGQG